jgi:hypothetical protein
MISRSQMNRQLYQIGGAGMQESQRDAQLSEQLQIEKAYRELVRRGLTEDEARQSIILQLSELKKMDNMPYAPSEDNDMYKNMPYAPSEDEDIMYKNMPYAPSEDEDIMKMKILCINKNLIYYSQVNTLEKIIKVLQICIPITK